MRLGIWLPTATALTLVGGTAWAQSAPNPFPQTRPTFVQQRPTFVQQPFAFSNGTGFASQPYQGFTSGVGLNQQRPAFTQQRPLFSQSPFTFFNGNPFTTQAYQGITPGVGLNQQRPAFTQKPYTYPNGTAFPSSGK